MRTTALALCAFGLASAASTACADDILAGWIQLDAPTADAPAAIESWATYQRSTREERLVDETLLPLVPLAEVAGFVFEREPTSAQTRLDRYLGDVMAQDAFDVGHVPAYFHDVGRSMRSAFAVDMGAAERERRASMSPFAILADELGRYAAGPSRPQDPVGMPPPEVSQTAFDARERALLLFQEQTSCLNAPIRFYRAEVRVSQNREGVVSGAWLTHASGVTLIDRAALEAVRAGAEIGEAPPNQTFGDGYTVESDWAFEVGEVASTWGATCGVDTEEGGQMGRAGHGIVRKRVTLLAVRAQTLLPPR